ncbi:Serine/threonine-protein kinase AFC2 [Gracilariopsis chorda]|uniref:Serine/threonine-protein kinase AFC2 n=1 Tax=Gracilariopsis chorda TaxID=448386 RepID=A0A2V3IFT6_9FLOR|nr:Serine/threonine-protein kinase AFC2 [Gracilariopsis chorda]|eukprot:PXF40921.1 Serine/threonine-protein kinase AFC2 [Gracilariopsis chorda]
MSRPASQSVAASAVRRARTHSLCADPAAPDRSVPPPAPSSPVASYPLRPRKRARLAPPPDPPLYSPTPDTPTSATITTTSTTTPTTPTTPPPPSPPSPRRRHDPHRCPPPPPPPLLQHPLRKPQPHYSLPTKDDPDGHLIYNLGDGLLPSSKFPNGRYKILSDLGEGTFGKVVECWDRSRAQRVAVKIIRSVTKYRQAARLEIDVLMHLKMHDPHQLYHCVKLYSWFDYQSHVCVVFEKLGPSLYEQLRRNRFRPFPLHQVRAFAFQLLQSIHFVHNLTLIHTDLKPENILLADSQRPDAIKLIDFGSATFESQHHSAVISTRHYRAPEVILGLGWTYPCDLWSVGCILIELYTGRALFQTHDNLEHLAMMISVLGPIPDSMIRRADCSGQKYFTRHNSGRKALNWPAGASSSESIRSVNKVQPLHTIIRDPHAHASFFDLVRRLLTFEPSTRCTSAEALQHPFFNDSLRAASYFVSPPSLAAAQLSCDALHNSCPTPRKPRACKRKSSAQRVTTVNNSSAPSSSSNAVSNVAVPICEHNDARPNS